MADTATKIRIFSLAKELGMDSKVLIEHCRSAGLTVKGSALASISPDEKELVLSHMGGAASDDSEAPAEATEDRPNDKVVSELAAVHMSAAGDSAEANSSTLTTQRRPGQWEAVFQ